MHVNLACLNLFENKNYLAIINLHEVNQTAASSHMNRPLRSLWILSVSGSSRPHQARLFPAWSDKNNETFRGLLDDSVSGCQATKLQIQNGGQYGDSSSSLARKVDSFAVACRGKKVSGKG